MNGLIDKNNLIQCARDAIYNYLNHGTLTHTELSQVDSGLQIEAATFVTLYLNNKLRGCVGSINAVRPLIHDIEENAVNAAFFDTRFHKLTSGEFSHINIEISILTPMIRIDYSNYEDLLAKIEPGTDGIYIKKLFKSATFLPSVWEQLPDKKEFLRHLLKKAALKEGLWDNQIEVFKYQVEKIR